MVRYVLGQFNNECPFTFSLAHKRLRQLCNVLAMPLERAQAKTMLVCYFIAR